MIAGNAKSVITQKMLSPGARSALKKSEISSGKHSTVCMTQETRIAIALVGKMYEDGMPLHQAVKKVKELTGGRNEIHSIGSARIDIWMQVSK